MAELSGIDTALAADRIIHDVGSLWMLSRRTFELGAEIGYTDPMSFYFAGRGGVLGEVDADVIVAAFGWWEPGFVRAKWAVGNAVGSATAAVQPYLDACAAWAERRELGNLPGAQRLAELAERVVAAAEPSGLPLFAAWRAQPRAESPAARLLQLVHVLRELRGAQHLVGTTAAGLAPVAAILTNEGEQQARMFGWTGELPDVAELKDRHTQAEDITNRLAGAVYERAFDPAERAEYAELVGALGQATLR